MATQLLEGVSHQARHNVPEQKSKENKVDQVKGKPARHEVDRRTVDCSGDIEIENATYPISADLLVFGLVQGG